MPYRDRGQSPHKTLGRPTGRVKASAYHPAYHRPQYPMKTPSACLETAVLSSDGGRDGGRNRGRQPEREGVHHGVRQIAATGECGPMRGVIGRVRLLSPRSARGRSPRGAGGRSLLQLSLLHQAPSSGLRQSSHCRQLPWSCTISADGASACRRWGGAASAAVVGRNPCGGASHLASARSRPFQHSRAGVRSVLRPTGVGDRGIQRGSSATPGAPRQRSRTDEVIRPLGGGP